MRAAETARTVWINARFLDRPVTGVERVARETLDALARHHLDTDGVWSSLVGRIRFRLIAPRAGQSRSPWPNLPLHRTGRLSGHAWEQVNLALATRGDWLVNLCNTGPLFKRHQLLFLHDAQPVVIPENFSWSFRTWYRVLYHVAGRSAGGLLVNSEFTREELHQHLGLPKGKMTVAHPGIEHLRAEGASDGALDAYALPDGPFLLAVSSANPNKNFASVVEAIRQLGEQAPPLVIVGQRHQAHFSEVELTSKKITHLGYVSDEALTALYRRAAGLVFPSFYEGFGLPPVEAMMNGCPVIAAKSSAIPEVCADAARYIDPHDPRSLATAIRELFTDVALGSELRRAGFQNVSRFSWQTSVAAMLRALERAMAGRTDDATQVIRVKNPHQN